eukprot:TRINITY_DN37182_c0_g1_i1.p1 TRINITY_DN37182_c0_g1~~TRINITY_DN37182_c0_g1_i1.p1  ORF type:complete len:258 (+),score=11.52 TRINITY_DN37182_c0_g1_i1:131-904(+)
MARTRSGAIRSGLFHVATFVAGFLLCFNLHDVPRSSDSGTQSPALEICTNKLAQLLAHPARPEPSSTLLAPSSNAPESLPHTSAGATHLNIAPPSVGVAAAPDDFDRPDVDCSRSDVPPALAAALTLPAGAASRLVSVPGFTADSSWYVVAARYVRATSSVVLLGYPSWTVRPNVTVEWRPVMAWPTALPIPHVGAESACRTGTGTCDACALDPARARDTGAVLSRRLAAALGIAPAFEPAGPPSPGSSRRDRKSVV